MRSVNAQKRNKLQFIDDSVLRRTSVIHSTLKNKKLRSEDSQMMDELSQQIYSLEELKAELKLEVAQKEERMQAMVERAERDKKEMEALRAETVEFRTNYVLKREAEREREQLLSQLKEREARILEFENLFHCGNMKEQSQMKEAYEAQMKHLEQQLRDSRDIIQEQHRQIHGRHDQMPSVDAMLRQKSLKTAEHGMESIDQKDEEILSLKQEVRGLKLEMARMKSAEYNDEKMAKLKRKNKTLEERLIKARSKNARLKPQVLREKEALKSEVAEIKKTVALLTVKWKFMEKKYLKQIRDCTDDLARSQRKLDVQIKGKRRLGNQMEMLDKMAQSTVKTAVHKRVISEINGAVNGNGNGCDEEQEEHDDLMLPENLRRVQTVIEDLTKKLQRKHERINELESKLAVYEFRNASMAQQSMHSIMIKDEALSPSPRPSVLGNLGAMQFGTFSATTTDILEAMPDSVPAICNELSGTPDDTKSPEDSLYAMDELQSQEQYLKLFLSKQRMDPLPPTPEKALSLGFLVNKSKNIRISVDVNKSFMDILGELGVHRPADSKNLEMHIEQHPDPMERKVVVTADCMHRTLWDLILEFGVFSLLRFSVTTNAAKDGMLMDTLQVQTGDAKKSSIFKRFKSKKSVSK